MYGIIGKICLIGLREMPTTTHRMMINIFLRVCISRVLYGASNHIISLTKMYFIKKIIFYQKCLSAIFTLLQINAHWGERKKLQKIKVVLLDSPCWTLPIGYLTCQFWRKIKSPWWPRVWRELELEKIWGLKCAS